MLKTLVVVAVTIITLATASTTGAKPPQPLGGLVDLEAYCQTKGFDWVIFPRGQLAPHAAVNNWACATVAGASEPLDMTQACKWQYGLKSAHARFTTVDNAFTWVCYSSANT
jgi:hypothetical protein